MTAKITSFGNNCLISVPFTGNNFSLLNNLPGFKKWKDGSRDLIFRPTNNNIKYINQHWPDADWDKSTRHILDQFIKEQLEASAAVVDKYAELKDTGDYLHKTVPFNHQRQLFLLSRDKKSFAYFMEQGTGKTKVGIDTACWLYSQGKIDSLVIIAPNGVHDNWIDEEIIIHLPDWCPYQAWTYSAKMTKKREKKFYEVMNAKDKLRIFAFNTEGFVSDKARKFLEIILSCCKSLVELDESQYLKNISAERTKYLTKACKDVEYKRIMTGTNITKGIEDLYGQLSFLDKDVLGFDSFTTFRNHFCTMGGYEMRQIVGYKNIDELIKLLDPYSFRVTKDECLDLPKKLYKKWIVELTPKQRELYDKLDKDFYAEMNGKQITANLAIVRLMRLQQITCGWFPDDEMTPIAGDNPKLEAVKQHTKDIIGQVIVWCGGVGNSHDIRNITEELRREHGRDAIEPYYGEVSNKDRAEIRKEFQAGNLKAIVANSAAARGLTLTKCENPIYFSNSFDLEFRLQSEDRTHRIGTVNNVLYTDIVAKRTKDRKIINALIRKKNIADMVNQDPESFFLQDKEDA